MLAHVIFKAAERAKPATTTGAAESPLRANLAMAGYILQPITCSTGMTMFLAPQARHWMNQSPSLRSGELASSVPQCLQLCIRVIGLEVVDLRPPRLMILAGVMPRLDIQTA